MNKKNIYVCQVHAVGETGLAYWRKKLFRVRVLDNVDGNTTRVSDNDGKSYWNVKDLYHKTDEPCNGKNVSGKVSNLIPDCREQSDAHSL